MTAPNMKSLILQGTDKDTTHSYIDIYQPLFADIHDTASNILEIGVQTGQSIMLWRDFFSNAVVYGLDINTIPPILKKINNVICHQANAYDTNFIAQHFLNKVNFDIIIDDGPHTLDSMKFVAQHYTPLLSSNGILVIEDVQSISWVDEIIKYFPEEYKNYVYVEDRRNIKGRYDDILIILDKRKIIN